MNANSLPKYSIEHLPGADGRVGMKLVERYFWQSRMTVAGRLAPIEEVQLFDPNELAAKAENDDAN